MHYKLPPAPTIVVEPEVMKPLSHTHDAPGPAARAAALKRHGAVGGLAEPLYRRLRRDPALVEAAAELLLDAHFPESMHDAIRERVGLRRDAGGASLVREEWEADDLVAPRRPPDPRFVDWHRREVFRGEPRSRPRV